MTDNGEFWVGSATAPETYQLVALLGGGGEGEVWKAILPLSDAGRRPVAVKIMRGTGAPDEGALWSRFGHLLQSLAHPGLVRVTDVFLGPGQHRRGDQLNREIFRYVVMDYVEGPTLRDWIDENPVATAAGRLALLRTAASALDEMHSGSRTEVPVAHGDVKPANIIVGPSGGTVLVDLGLARLADAAGVAGRSNPYAAPELRTPHAQATPEADAYAFAVTTAQVLTGQVPPTDASGFLDVAALQTQLQTAPHTQRRPMLVHQVLTVLASAPEARPRLLRRWLDAAADTLSQVTTPPAGAPAALVAGVAVSEEATQLSASVPTGTAGPYPPQPSGRAEPAPGPRPTRRKWPLIAALAIILLLAVGGGAYALSANHGKRKAAAKSPPTTTAHLPTNASVSTVPTTDVSASSGTAVPTGALTLTNSSAPPTDTGFPSTQPITTQWVSDLTQVNYDQESQEGPGITQTGQYSTNGRSYPHSLYMTAGCYNRDGGDYWLEYDLARQWSVLTAVMGLEETSPSGSRMSWKVYGDGKLLASGAQTLGTSKAIHVAVKHILRLRLLINDPSNTSSSCPNPEPGIVWGNLQLTA